MKYAILLLFEIHIVSSDIAWFALISKQLKLLLIVKERVIA